MADIEDLIADIKKHRERTANAAAVASPELRNELGLNLWPWLEGFAKAVQAKLEVYEDAFDELLQKEQSYLQPELSGQIVGALQTAKAICGEFSAHLKTCESGGDADERSRMAAFLAQCETAFDGTIAEISAVTLDETDDDLGTPGPDDEGDADPADDGAEAPAPQPAPQPAPAPAVPAWDPSLFTSVPIRGGSHPDGDDHDDR